MKKILVLFLVAVMMFSFAGCGKSEKVTSLEDMIASLGEITIDSEEKINEARTLYNSLEDKEKEKVENYAVLEESEVSLQRIKEEIAKAEAETELAARTRNIGETAATDIVEVVLERAELAIALESTIGKNFGLPKEYNAQEDAKNPFVAAKGHVLLSATFTLTNTDRDTVNLDGTFNPTFIKVNYNDEEYELETEYLYESTDGVNWEDIVGLGNVLLSAGEKITKRCFWDVPVEPETLSAPMDLIFCLPNSDGSVTEYIFKVNE